MHPTSSVTGLFSSLLFSVYSWSRVCACDPRSPLTVKCPTVFSSGECACLPSRSLSVGVPHRDWGHVNTHCSTLLTHFPRPKSHQSLLFLPQPCCLSLRNPSICFILKDFPRLFSFICVLFTKTSLVLSALGSLNEKRNSVFPFVTCSPVYSCLSAAGNLLHISSLWDINIHSNISCSLAPKCQLATWNVCVLFNWFSMTSCWQLFALVYSSLCQVVHTFIPTCSKHTSVLYS